MYRPRRSDAGTDAPMRWLAGRQRADSTGRAYLPPNTAWLPSAVLVDPASGYLHIVSAPGQFAVYGSAQPYLTQRRLFRRRTAGFPQPRHAETAQVPPERAGRHRVANPAHGRHAVRTPGRGKGSWFKKQRARSLFGLTRAEWKEVRAETLKFTGIGWTGLTANMLGVIGAGGTLTGSTAIGLAAAMGWAPFQGVIAGIVNVRKMRKAADDRQTITALRDELVQAGYLPPAAAQQDAAATQDEVSPAQPSSTAPQGPRPTPPTAQQRDAGHRRGEDVRSHAAGDPRRRDQDPRQPGL